YQYQIWATDEIYFIKDNKFFVIQMLDVDSKGGRAFYDLFLSTFKFIGLEEATKEEAFPVVEKGEDEPEEKGEEMVDCGKDKECFEQRFKVCKPAKSVSSDAIIFIEGVEGETCVIRMGTPDGLLDMKCKIPDYATVEFGDYEFNILPYCNWQIYMSEKYGFGVKYPQDWELARSGGVESDFGQLSSFWIASDEYSIGPYVRRDSFIVNTWDSSFYSYDLFLKDLPPGIDSDTIKKKEIIFDGQLAIELSYMIVGDAGSGAREGKRVFVQKDQIVYTISCDPKKCDKILSTFKFIE
ncbi:hypothetical protein KKF60_03040, partial [Patescibacteria group bacterium]|nr:hypothetical protein [Patescibacteria group bacterium]MCG2695827.1 hypothetical protein [Candidatus Portnoybacteria bacterium]